MTTEFDRILYNRHPYIFKTRARFSVNLCFVNGINRTELVVYRVLSCVVLVTHIDVNMLHVIRKLDPVVVFPEAGPK